MTSRWTQLEALGQSVWYDNVARPALASGLLERLIADDHVTGGTSNPSIFAKAVLETDLYDDDIAAAPDDAPELVFERSSVADIQAACDLTLPIWRRTRGFDGWISIEEEPDVAFDRARAVHRGHELKALVDRPNVMVKVPGTQAGVEAFGQLTREGVSVNVTLLFSADRYRDVAAAYVEAISQRLDAGEDVTGVNSVASFFVSRIDARIDALLPQDSPLRGTIAVANAKLAYADVFIPTFGSKAWQKLSRAGANVQRPLWASTGVKDEHHSPTLYIDELVGPDTVTTVPDATIEAVRNGSALRRTLESGLPVARDRLAALRDADIDLDEITTQLEHDGIEQFADAYRSIIEAIATKQRSITSDPVGRS